MKPEHEFTLPLDERNFAHVLAALALAGLAAEVGEGRCWWSQSGFVLRISLDESTLFQRADVMLRELRWVPGLGVDATGKIVAGPHHGIMHRGASIGTNPFLSYAEAGKEKSPLKTFSGQVNPGTILAQQLALLFAPPNTTNWLQQRDHGVGSWGFDSSIGSHAYDQGYSSNDEGSGDADPLYPAVELLGLAGAAFFSVPQMWQEDDRAFRYTIWREALPLSLAPLAIAGQIEGLKGSDYTLATRGAAYGKGAAYTYFPEASLIPTTQNL